MSPLAKAANAWAKQPRRARREAIAFFKAEAEQSRAWAKEAPLFGSKAGNLADAKALGAALRLLRAAQGKGR